MYVRYLQHQHHGTVQLLMMPLSTAPGSGKNSKWGGDGDEDDSGECEPVPLPIQTFLWRQTNPFLGAKIGKLHESSCVTFERVVVQNILHGLSPSLSDAIGSVSRWRFVRAAFPHIVQCCGALLTVRANEDESLPMSGSLVKIMYILHWLILDAAHECNEVIDAENVEVSLKKLTYSIPCIQMFVYLIAPLCHVIKEEEIESHIRLESGLRLWQALWQFRQPDVLCFSAPVKQRKNHFPQLSNKSKKPAAPIALEQGIYLGDDQFNTRRASNVHSIPQNPTKPSTSVQEDKIERVTEEVTVVEPEKHSYSKIVRSVSDYKTSDLASNGCKMAIRKSRTDMFHPSDPEYNGLNNIDEAMQFTEDGSFSESFHFNDKAPLVQLQEICSGASLDTSDTYNEPVCPTCRQKPCQCALTPKAPSKTPIQINKCKADDADSVGSQQTVINKPLKVAQVPRTTPILVFNDQKDSLSSGTDKSDTSVVHDLNEATFLDVGTLKCLLIKNWSEDGVYWATKYFLNRLTEIRQHRLISEATIRCRSNSVPTIAPRGSKHDLCCPEYLTWTDLQERSEVFQRTIGSDENNDDIKAKVAFNVERKGSEKNAIKLRVVAEKRRVSVNTLPAIKHASKHNGKRRRNKSEPCINMPTAISVNTIKDEDSENGKGRYFSEALGSSLFIQPNGYIKLDILLKSLVGVVERCSAIRILEIILNICDILLTMPGLGNVTIFEDVTKIVLKVYIHLGCPNGCNEGMRTPQADFMRIKLKNLLSQMNKSGEGLLTGILKSQVMGSTCQSLLDYLHAMTSFCEFDPSHNRSRSALSQRRTSSLKENKMPSYRNNFNEGNAGMEGIILNTLLNPLISKLMNKTAEITLPENIGLYHDVQLFFAYVNEYHGNPLRRSALSAMTPRIKTDDGDSGSRSRNDSVSTRQGPEGSISSHQRDNASLRRGLLKRKNEKQQAMNAEESEPDSSPSTPRNQPSMDDNISSTGSPQIYQGAKKKSGGKLHFALNLLKSVRNEASEDENWEDANNLDDSVGDEVSATLAVESKSRISFRNMSSKMNSFRQRQSLSIDTGYTNEASLESNPHKILTEKLSIIQLYLPSKRNVNIFDIREGVRRFRFLMETCRPGQVPDAPLLAALMELKAPVISRAAILLECANFVYRCNKGEWPEWMRSSMNTTNPRNANLSASSRSVIGGSRKMVILQRAAGRSFYDWGIQLGARLQRLLEKSVELPKDTDEKRRLKTFDDIEDFLDDATVNDASGEYCPPVLLLMASHLLYQITAFLRETFQLLPRSKIPNKSTGSTTGWERIMSNRRWSILSNTFNPQTGSMHSINDLHPERRVSYSTADEDSSPRGSHDLGDDSLTNSGSDKKMRRLAQGRQRLLKRGSPSGGPQSSLESSRKRREASFRRKTRSPAEAEEGIAEAVPLNGKSRDSLKPSNIKHSVTNDDLNDDSYPSPERRPGANSAMGNTTTAQHLPHTLEDDEEEMIRNIPWLKVMITVSKKFDIECTHDKYCSFWCFDRVYRQCNRLTDALHMIYAENEKDKKGFFLIMPTIMRCYSQRQTNKLFKNIVEFICKQFYILHRKPFLLQMFGSIADICDQNNDDLEINAMQIKAKYLFNLLLAMEDMNELEDELDILPLVPYPKPLKALDLCYRDDPNTFLLLPDAIASCVTVCAFAPESKRSHQMLLIMQAVIPHLLNNLEHETTRQNNIPSALKQEITAYTTICVEMRALINSCETLSRGPTRAFEAVSGGNDRGKSFIAESPQFFDPPTVAEEEPKNNLKERKNQNTTWDNVDNSELQKELYRGPREALLLLCAMFIEKAGKRLKELTKLSVNLEHFKIPEMFDARCHVKISDVALSLLKVAPYDLTTMGSQGLQKYFLVILPVVDWSVETSRSALNIILRRLDKAISKIAKKSSSRKRANWNAIANWLNGLYQTLVAYPYIAHLHPLKTMTQMCLRLIAGDTFSEDLVSAPNLSSTTNNTILNPQIPPYNFCAISLKMAAFMMQALGQFAFSLEIICSHEGLGAASERPEAVLCHILIPLFFSAAAPGKEAPQFQAKDILFILNFIHNTINPTISKQNTPTNAGTTLASSLIRGAVASHNTDASGRQGSISVTDKGHIATVSTHRIIRESVVQSVFLALKVLIVVFHRQLTAHWVKISRIVKDIASKRLGGSCMYNFMEFASHLNLPISLIIVPVIQQKLNQRNISEQEAAWHNDFRDRLLKIKKVSLEDIKGYSQLLTRLQQELNHMKDDFSSRLVEFPRSHTPTIGDLNSDSGSTQSVSTHKSGRPNESRRLSSSTAFSKLRNAGKSISSTGHQSMSSDAGGHNLHDATILEDIEDETTQMMTGKMQKSPSFPSTRHPSHVFRARSITGLGVFRSMRRKSTTGKEEMLTSEDEAKPFRLKDMHHRRTKSWNKKHKTLTDDSVLISPLTMPQSRIQTAGQSIAESFHQKSTGSSGGDRHRVVSFSTQEYNKSSQPSETDSDEYYITAKHHLI
uniref:UNC80 domain-containing protein n=1 Tax=Bursaphelenchus xylophilus TaxID=6326 RepID=A0A1I7ST06_BURXY